MASTDTTFVKSTTIIAIVFTALGTFGLVTSPQQAWPLVLATIVLLCVVVVYDRLSILNEHGAEIRSLKESLLLEKRLNKIEEEISYQRGILQTMSQNKKGDADQNILLFAMIIGVLFMLYLIFFAKTPVTP